MNDSNDDIENQKFLNANQNREKTLKTKNEARSILQVDKTKVINQLSTKQVWAFSIGHVTNDIVASIWFNYTLFYLTNIVKLNNMYTGLTIFLGQFFDFMGTILAGRLNDSYPKIKIYIPGTIILLFSYLMIYVPSYISESQLICFIYYASFGSLLNLGFAFVMNSHFSLISHVTHDVKIRGLIIERKVAFGFIAQIITLLLSYFIFCSQYDDLTQYYILSILCCIIGVFFTSIFLYYFINVDSITYYENYIISDENTEHCNIGNKKEFQNRNKSCYKDEDNIALSSKIISHNPLYNGIYCLCKEKECECNCTCTSEDNEECKNCEKCNENFDKDKYQKLLENNDYRNNNINTPNDIAFKNKIIQEKIDLDKVNSKTVSFKKPLSRKKIVEVLSNSKKDVNSFQIISSNGENFLKEESNDINNSKSNKLTNFIEDGNKSKQSSIISDNNNDNIKFTTNTTEAIDLKQQENNYLSDEFENYGFVFTKLFVRYFFFYVVVTFTYNITYSAVPYYVIYVLNVQISPTQGTPLEITKVYLSISLGSIINMLVTQRLVKSYKRDYMIITSLGIVIFSMLPFMIFYGKYSNFLLIFFFIFGIGLSILLSTAFEMVNDFIGFNKEKSGKIYSIFALGDKLLSGIGLFFLVNNVKDDVDALSWLFPFISPSLIIIAYGIFIFFKEKKMDNTEELHLKNKKIILNNDGKNVFGEDISMISKLNLVDK